MHMPHGAVEKRVGYYGSSLEIFNARPSDDFRSSREDRGQAYSMHALDRFFPGPSDAIKFQFQHFEQISKQHWQTIRALNFCGWQLVCFYYVLTTFTTVGYGKFCNSRDQICGKEMSFLRHKIPIMRFALGSNFCMCL